MHKRFSRGFTVVELIIVVVVISILAVISVVAYDGVTERANDGAVRSDLKNLADALNVYYGDNGHYPIYQADLDSIQGVKMSRDNYDTSVNALIYCTETDVGTDMVVMGMSLSKHIFYIKNEEGVKEFTPAGATLDCSSLISDVALYYVHNTSSGWAANF